MNQTRLRKALRRREFLAVSALATLTGVGVCGIGGIAGWLLIRRRRQAARSAAPDAGGTPILVTPIPPVIVPRSVWGARPVNLAARDENGLATQANPQGWHEYRGDLAQVYRTIAVHHSYPFLRDSATMLQIQEAHQDSRRWADIGYHYGIGADGTIYEGRDIRVRGANVENYNWGTAGVVLMGDFEQEAPTEAQLIALHTLIAWLTATLRCTHLAGHSDFNPRTQCPGDNLRILLDQIAQASALIRGTGGYMPPPPDAFPASTPAP
jgi:hypothetical protein